MDCDHLIDEIQALRRELREAQQEAHRLRETVADVRRNFVPHLEDCRHANIDRLRAILDEALQALPPASAPDARSR